LERQDEKTARRWLDWAYEEDNERSTNSVIRRLWSATDQTSATATRAALALAVESGAGGELPGRLRRAAEESVGEQRVGVNLAEARGAVIREEPEAVLAAVESLGQQGHASPEVHLFKIAALEKLKRWEDVKQFEASLRSSGEKRIPLESMEVMTEFRAGRIAEGMAMLESLDGRGKAGPAELNEAAWATLFVAGHEDKALRWAQRATELTRYQRPNLLNTLAAIYAWQGKPREAYRLVVQTLDLVPDRKPTASDWVVMGRVSEDYGLAEEARRLYQRAIEEDQHRGFSSVLSTTRLAQLQLERLKTERPGTPTR
jgi:tetratricopeptide (TPR) repeat protein